jgi:hypothetical protein
VQLSESGKQTPLLWATQVEVPGSQMPEQQRVLSPWHGCPTSRQPKALNGGGGGGAGGDGGEAGTGEGGFCFGFFLCFL